MGHASTVTTRIYVHIVGWMSETPARFLEAMLSGWKVPLMAISGTIVGPRANASQGADSSAGDDQGENAL